MRDKLVAAYGAPSDVKLVNWDLGTEAAVIEPDRLLARLHVRTARRPGSITTPTFRPPSARRSTVWPTGGELMYVFGTLPDHDLTVGTRTIAAATPADRKSSAAMTDDWVAFAKTGQSHRARQPGLAGLQPVHRRGPGVRRRRRLRQTGLHKATLDLVEQMAAPGNGR